MVNIKLPRKPKDVTKCLSNVSKFLSSEWDYTLNILTPGDISYGSTFKVWWVCSICNHNWQTSVNNRFLKGSGCPKCASKAKGANQKLSIDFIKQEAHKLSFWEVLSEEYISAKTKLLCRCKTCGIIHNISWDKLRQGQRCYKCYLKKLSNKLQGKIPIGFIEQTKKLDFDSIKLSFLAEGYIVTSDVYLGSSLPLSYICPYEHKHKITWDNWKQGKRCPTCYTISKLGEGHWNWQGGKSFEPYCPIWKDYDYKESIKLRDAYVCQNPYCYKTVDRLHIHHIDYNKQNCHPSNLITVCGSCNIRANKDRDWHTEWYQIIMNKQYGYNY